MSPTIPTLGRGSPPFPSNAHGRNAFQCIDGVGLDKRRSGARFWDGHAAHKPRLLSLPPAAVWFETQHESPHSLSLPAADFGCGRGPAHPWGVANAPLSIRCCGQRPRSLQRDLSWCWGCLVSIPPPAHLPAAGEPCLEQRKEPTGTPQSKCRPGSAPAVDAWLRASSWPPKQQQRRPCWVAGWRFGGCWGGRRPGRSAGVQIEIERGARSWISIEVESRRRGRQIYEGVRRTMSEACT